MNSLCNKPTLVKELGMMLPKETSKKKERYGIYECPSCKEHYKTMTKCINSGASTKCRRCASKNRNRKHGDSNARLYKTWSDMKKRCYNKTTKSFKNYGALGVIVCDEWKDNYSAFKEWAVENGYTDKLTIDRIDSYGNYEPSNCRWSTMKTQARNKRLAKGKFRGIQKNGNNWATLICVDYKHIYLGTYKTKELAAQAYDQYVIEHNLEHTRNFQ